MKHGDWRSHALPASGESAEHMEMKASECRDKGSNPSDTSMNTEYLAECWVCGARSRHPTSEEGSCP